MRRREFASHTVIAFNTFEQDFLLFHHLDDGTTILIQAPDEIKPRGSVKATGVEVKFSLTATGELGNYAIGKVAIEANYEVTLKWKNKPKVAKKV